MSEHTGPAGGPVVVGSDEQREVDIDIDRWVRLATDVLVDAGVIGELTLTFVDVEEITALNEEHLDGTGPTDVLSFPLDDDPIPSQAAAVGATGVPVLLGDVVVCPSVARDAAATHAGTLDDELALLVVHGVLHVLGHDHAEPEDATRMRSNERDLLERHHWHGPTPEGFSHVHVDG